MPVEHAHLVGGREDVGQHEDLLVAGTLGHRVGGGVGEGHPDVFGLGAVDEVAEDPTSAAEALSVTALAAVAARPQALMHDTSTRSPGATVVTPEPTDSTVPTAS